MSAATVRERIGAPSLAAPSLAFAPAEVAEVLLTQFAPRAITLVCRQRLASESGLAIRPSANDCYAVLDEACFKMARVAARKLNGSTGPDSMSLQDRISGVFPDPHAYLACAIKSVLLDTSRAARREPKTISFDTPLTVGSDALALADTLADTKSDCAPEAALLQASDSRLFRSRLSQALRGIPANYLDAIRRDIARERNRTEGARPTPMSDQERQTLCRARGAVSKALRREGTSDNPYLQMMEQQRTTKVSRKIHTSSAWSGAEQQALLQKLIQSGWVSRSAEHRGDAVEEAVVNYVNASEQVAPPSPEFRQSMRVLDLYKMDFPVPASEAARAFYERARQLRTAGNLEEAIRAFKACYDAEPTFVEALSEVGVLQSQLGNLREALRIYMSIVDRFASGEHRCRAATNAADIHLTWFDAGRNCERNIESAIRLARTAMERPTPMRAANLILALVKDRYYLEARDVLQEQLALNSASCPAERLLSTLFQIRDNNLISWWSWLDSELEKG